MIKRFEVYLVALDPTLGREIKKTRPCVVVSPDEMNAGLQTLLIAPLTSQGFAAPSRIPLKFQGKQGLIVLDQMRAVDRVRLVKRMGQLDAATSKAVLSTLQELFS